jgi:hypothetical protein
LKDGQAHDQVDQTPNTVVYRWIIRHKLGRAAVIISLKVGLERRERFGVYV